MSVHLLNLTKITAVIFFDRELPPAKAMLLVQQTSPLLQYHRSPGLLGQDTLCKDL